MQIGRNSFHKCLIVCRNRFFVQRIGDGCRIMVGTRRIPRIARRFRILDWLVSGQVDSGPDCGFPLFWEHAGAL